MPQTPPAQKDDETALSRRIERLVAGFSETNRTAVRDELRRRRNKGVKDSSNRVWLEALARVEKAADGQSFCELKPDEWVTVLEKLRQSAADSTVANTVVQMRSALARFLRIKELPPAIGEALEVRAPRRAPVGRVLTDEHFRQVLATVPELEGAHWHFPQTLELQALLWLFWDAGLRARELISLNLGDLLLEDARGGRLSLRPEAPGLKTGPREIYVAESIPAVRAWLGAHPNPGNPRAPLFPGPRSATGRDRICYTVLHKLVQRLGNLSGVNAATSRTKPLSPHDFRHTAATRRARMGWNEAQLCAYFGWRPGSKMAAHYVHLSFADLRLQVRRDAGVDDLGFVQKAPSADPAQALANLIQQLARQQPVPVAQVAPATVLDRDGIGLVGARRPGVAA